MGWNKPVLSEVFMYFVVFDKKKYKCEKWDAMIPSRPSHSPSGIFTFKAHQYISLVIKSQL